MSVSHSPTAAQCLCERLAIPPGPWAEGKQKSKRLPTTRNQGSKDVLALGIALLTPQTPSSQLVLDEHQQALGGMVMVGSGKTVRLLFVYVNLFIYL